ncbi:hypothetical protein LSH36_44g13012 [Paralvinella palmiformis]|uniref:Cytochrome P450 n=1 Tax=Paralvinella palmiformis TaxID=53620 RepID=A0AAD9NDG1_9ANNE|nr:hypothetical protein LSH36_44g13012 [Paralvinella palmiformis]
MAFFLPDVVDGFLLRGYVMAILFAFLVFVLCKGVLAIYFHRKRIQHIKRLPIMTGGNYLFGILAEIPGPDERALSFLRDVLLHYPRLAYGVIGPFNVILMVNHPEPMKAILQTSEPKPFRFGAYKVALPWLGEGLIIAGGKKWSRNRRLLTPAFHFDILRQNVAVHNSSADVLIIILRCAFSYDENVHKLGQSHPYVKAVQELSQDLAYRYLRPWLHSDLLFALSQTGRRFSKNCRFVHSIADNIIRRRRQTLKKNENKEKNKYLDFLDILLTAKDEQGQGLTDKEIRVEVDTFLFEGHDTTASGISWTLYSLAQNPEWQKMCQQEIDQILDGRDSDDICWNCIGQNFAMHEMKVVIGKILRRFSITTDKDRPVRHEVMVVMKTEAGMYLKAKLRNNI